MIGALLRPPWLRLKPKALFIAVLFGSILSFYFLVWWPALCEPLHHCSGPGFMNEPTLRQRLSDGSDPAVMSL